ncbi:unnamed protein product [Cuscuta epithymum]|uniref:Replication factor A C-terminal domain-containing protein n=1 Tax=Cuscuta epithymum TaxID=186058 RepID=A0AAV0G5D1_9ASTE|nr:unnamed protein product [Cuscuta epithymum]
MRRRYSLHVSCPGEKIRSTSSYTSSHMRFRLPIEMFDETGVIHSILFTNEVQKLLNLINNPNPPHLVDCADLNEKVKDLTFIIAVKTILKKYRGELKKNISVLCLSLPKKESQKNIVCNN